MSKLTCDNCGKPLDLNPAIPHKRFCGDPCRMDFHAAERREAMALLRLQKAKIAQEQL